MLAMGEIVIRSRVLSMIILVLELPTTYIGLPALRNILL